MEGFNPNQSLIPAVGGNITPMSGGGYTDAGGAFREFGLTLAEYNAKKDLYEPIIKKLLPSITAGIETLFTSRGSDENPTNDQIITETLSSVGKMNKNDIQILVQSKYKEFVITEINMPDILAGYKTQIDSDKIQVYFDETGLVIDINNDMKVATPTNVNVTTLPGPTNVTTLPGPTNVTTAPSSPVSSSTRSSGPYNVSSSSSGSSSTLLPSNSSASSSTLLTTNPSNRPTILTSPQESK